MPKTKQRTHSVSRGATTSETTSSGETRSSGRVVTEGYGEVEVYDPQPFSPKIRKTVRRAATKAKRRR